ncbi:Nn.00g084710.m01.CDS01 [Neocucurbitaria sp. VM-36]
MIPLFYEYLLCLFSLLVPLTQGTAELELPTCAQLCRKSVFSTDTCTPTDHACICTNKAFHSAVTLCVTTNCTIPEALATQNFSLANCGAPTRNHGHSYAVISNVLIVVAGACVAVRFVFKATVSRLDFGCDDWAVLATFIAAVPSAVLIVHGTVKNGLGRDIWTLTPMEITAMLKYFYFLEILYFTQLLLQKLSVIFFFVRVFPGPGVQCLLRVTVAFVTLWGIAFVIAAIFPCRPIHYFWTRWDGLHYGWCLNINALAASNAGISIVLDFWMLGIPLWQLRSLKLHWKKKISVALMFCVGTFVTLVSILRLKALVHFAFSSNVSWEFLDVSVWSSIEICVGIICVCLPTLRLLVVKTSDVLGGSSSRSRKRNDNCISDRQLKLVDTEQGHKSSAAVTLPRPSIFNQGHGITVQSTYAVRHSLGDTDKASLMAYGGRGKV